MDQITDPQIDIPPGLRPAKPPVLPPRLGAGSFSVIRKTYLPDWEDDEQPVPVRPALLSALFELVAAQVFVDEAWYLTTHPDVGEAIADGKFQNAKHHYMTFGYFEDRIPHFINVDEDFYKTHNRDIEAGLAQGSIISCQWHFEKYGFKEGRLPYENWQLFNNG
jgi:hypothetical protein